MNTIQRAGGVTQAARALCHRSLQAHLEIACGLVFDPEVHGDLIDALQGHADPIKRSQEKYHDLVEIIAILARGGWKSTLFAGYVTWRLARDRNTRAFLNGATQGQSAKRVLLARQMLERPMMQNLYGPFRGDFGWNLEFFTVTGRTEDYQEPSYYAMGRESFKPGGHHDIRGLDDFEDQDTCNTADLIEHGREIDSLGYPMTDRPRALTVVLGTFWDDADVHRFKIERFGLYDTSEKGAIVKRPVHGKISADGKRALFFRPGDDGSGNALFPRVWSADKLDNMRSSMSVSSYASQVCLDPIAHEDAPFKEHHIVMASSLPPGELSIIFGYDFAQSATARADRTGISGVAMANDGVWYIFEGERYRLDTAGMMDAIFQRATAFPKAIHCVEADNFVKGWRPAFDVECRKRRLFPTVEWVDSGARKKKDDRILALTGVYHSKSVRHLHGTESLIGELLRFPRGERRDIADSLANVLEIVQAPAGNSYAGPPEKKKHRYAAWMERDPDAPWNKAQRNQPYKNVSGDKVPWKAA